MLGAMLPTRGARLAAPLLLVADLDDTLISKNAELDAGSAAFKALWERSSAAGMRCKLAINTGRQVQWDQGQAWLVQCLAQGSLGTCNCRLPSPISVLGRQDAAIKAQSIALATLASSPVVCR